MIPKRKILLLLYTGLGIVTFIMGFFYLNSLAVPNVSNDVIEIYYADNMSEAHLKVVELFNKKYKDQIIVHPIDLPFSRFSTNERKELLARTLRSGSERIDIFAVDQIWVSRFAKWCEPLDDYISESERNNILSYALSTCEINGELMSLPVYLDLSVMFYRRDILEKYFSDSKLYSRINNPITWEEMLEIGSSHNKIDSSFYIFQGEAYEGLVCSYMENVLAVDDSFFYREKVDLTLPVSKKSVQLLVDLVNKYKLTPVEVAQFVENESYSYFLENECLFLRGWPTFEGDYKNLIRIGEMEDQLEFTFLPYFSEGKPSYIFGGWNLMISKFSKNKVAALEFLRYMVGEEAQKNMLKLGRYIPINRELLYDEKLRSENPYVNKLIDFLPFGIHRPKLKDYTRISDIIAVYLNKAIKGEMTVDEALEIATNEINTDNVL